MALLEAQETKALIMLLLWLHMDDGASRGTRNKGSDYVAAVAAHG